MGTKRAGTTGSFVSTVLAALDEIDEIDEIVVERVRLPEPDKSMPTAAKPLTP